MAVKYGSTSKEHLRYKPEEFSWENQQLLDQKTNQYMNRDAFSYDVANDPMYKQYKEQYAAMGNLAMQDTMGQAAALTGGYGNTYAQTAGQQTYQNYLNQVNQMVPELAAAARSNYEAEGNRLYNEIALLEGQKATAYNAYQNDLNDWYNYLNMLQNQEQLAIENDRYEREMRLQEQQAAAEIANAAKNAVTDMGTVKETLAGLNDTQRRNYLNELISMGMAPATAYSLYNGDTAAEEKDSTFKKANYRREEDGLSVFDFGDDKEVKLAKGINPYTRTKNPDVKNGTFSNGYQPNNIGGKNNKLSATGDYIWVDGVKQNVWKTPDGTRYVWVGTENSYVKESEIDYEY